MELHNGELGIPLRLRHGACPHLSAPPTSFTSVLSCSLNRRINENSKKTEKEKRGDRSQRAACLLWVGNDIMRGLQCLVGGSFYSNCQDKCAIIHFDWVSVCARSRARTCTAARRTCVTGSWLRGLWGGGKREREGRENGRKGGKREREKAKRGVT